MADLRHVLEQAILADPDDRAALTAWADHLAARGDARRRAGRLCSARSSAASPSLRRGYRGDTVMWYVYWKSPKNSECTVFTSVCCPTGSGWNSIPIPWTKRASVAFRPGPRGCGWT